MRPALQWYGASNAAEKIFDFYTGLLHTCILLHILDKTLYKTLAVRGIHRNINLGDTSPC